LKTGNTRPKAEKRERGFVGGGGGKKRSLVFRMEIGKGGDALKSNQEEGRKFGGWKEKRISLRRAPRRRKRKARLKGKKCSRRIGG